MSVVRGTVSNIISGATDAMSSHMISTLDLAKGAMHDVVVANSISMVLGSQVAQVVATGLGAVLYKIEELEDLLPMRGQELAKLATPVASLETALAEQQKKQLRYLPGLVSLLMKLLHIAYQQCLERLWHAWQSTQERLNMFYPFTDLVKHIRSKPPGGEQPVGPAAPVVPAAVGAGVAVEQELIWDFLLVWGLCHYAMHILNFCLLEPNLTPSPDPVWGPCLHGCCVVSFTCWLQGFVIHFQIVSSARPFLVLFNQSWAYITKAKLSRFWGGAGQQGLQGSGAVPRLGR
ncbi:hypothetical protein Y1Q_0024381 [Alligator mississippiensis]|uniref:Perilipin n=1 Tax=Alligator mississippiensis TaxID=8496 RepID=A0A151NJ59_ALLMI|nr:hypothetical protein Y1Q_0024381 [Alligator mississippiensis]